MEIVKNATTIQSLQIGMGIMDAIAEQGRPLKFSDILKITQVTKSNLYKYLNTLTLLGLLYRDKESGTYILGSKMIQYGMKAIGHENVMERISPYLQKISDRSTNTLLYSTWTLNGPMVIRIFNNSQGLNIGAQIGTMLPLFSSGGKIFAAFMEETSIRSWLEKEMEASSSDKHLKLQEESLAIRKKGISFAREPIVPSISSVAVPILNYNRGLIGTIIIVGFTETIPQNEDEEFSQYLIQMSKEISECFGYRGS